MDSYCLAEGFELDGGLCPNFRSSSHNEQIEGSWKAIKDSEVL